MARNLGFVQNRLEIYAIDECRSDKYHALVGGTNKGGRPVAMANNDPKRRGFFREAAVRLITPLADYIEKRTDEPRDSQWLRPPGAISETALVEACIRCGACVEVCPADAIFALPESLGAAGGTPAIDPDLAACVVCDGLKCTTVCPSGALLPLVSSGDIAMGVAEVYAPLCVRSFGETCTACVDSCPIGEVAIRFVDDGPPSVDSAGCVGCDAVAGVGGR